MFFGKKKMKFRIGGKFRTKGGPPKPSKNKKKTGTLRGVRKPRTDAWKRLAAKHRRSGGPPSPKSLWSREGTRPASRRGEKEAPIDLSVSQLKAITQRAAAGQLAERKQRVFIDDHVDNAIFALREAQELKNSSGSPLVNDYFFENFDANIFLNPKTGLFIYNNDDTSPFWNSHIWESLGSPADQEEAFNFLNACIRGDCEQQDDDLDLDDDDDDAEMQVEGSPGLGLYLYRNGNSRIETTSLGGNKFKEKTITPTICKPKTVRNYDAETFGRCGPGFPGTPGLDQTMDATSTRTYEEM